MIKPNFFIIGASKVATTSLWNILRQHPNVFLGEIKEPSYFAFSNYPCGKLKYLSLFENAQNEKAIGEVVNGWNK